MRNESLPRQRRTLATFAGLLRLSAASKAHVTIALIVTLAVIGAMPAALAWATKDLLDAVADGADQSQFLSAALIVGVATTVMALLAPISRYLSEEARRQIGLAAELQIADKLNSVQGFQIYEDSDFYDVVQVAHQAAAQSGPTVIATLSSLVKSAATIVTFLGLIWAIEPRLLLAITIGMLPGLVIEPQLSKMRVQTTLSISPLERRRMFYYQLLLVPIAAREVRIYGLGHYFRQRMASEYAKINELERLQDRRELRWHSLGLLAGGIAVMAALALVANSAADGNLTPGDIAVVLAAVTAVQSAARGIIAGLAHLDIASRLFVSFEALNNQPDQLDRSGDGQPAPVDLRVGITFDNVWFRYSDETPWVLKDMSFHFPAGELFGLVGENGSGKSTMIKLILRLYDPDKGRILWDGVDLRKFDVTSLRERYAVVMQDHMAYDVIAHENVGLGDVVNMESDERVRSAAKVAGIHDRIESLPAGYKTMLSRMFAGDDSIPDLSGGEWQRISIARGAMRLPAAVTILDEPTASLDAVAEEHLFATFERLIAGRTCFLVSHRFTTLKSASSIVMLQDGAIAEAGTHQELMDLNGRYAELYKQQLERMSR